MDTSPMRATPYSGARELRLASISWALEEEAHADITRALRSSNDLQHDPVCRRLAGICVFPDAWGEHGNRRQENHPALHRFQVRRLLIDSSRAPAEGAHPLVSA